ncbi:hypothetical protein B0H16DRAFT_293718 [Mycena metata]|uniref:Uncharacterized protein n=1 Tax=Mycena metata TaxID=1033252 RepID=A0AAD7KF67_9AGAR|nr:hypothetical protein B0H16DRAFT_293718 [Mycena metata]
MATARTRTRPLNPYHSSRRMKKRRLSFQAIFAGKDAPDTRNYKTLPRSFGAAYAAYYDADAAFPPSLPVSVSDIKSNEDDDDSSSFLLDDDPFADLTGGPLALDTSVPLPESSPSSPLHSPTALPPVGPPPPPPMTRTATAHTTPAHQKPAFRARPSLPSLHTLAQMSVLVPHKVRRGHVGAGLPYEPWDLDAEGAFTASPVSVVDGVLPLPPSTPTSPIPIPTSPKQQQQFQREGIDSLGMALSTTPTPANPNPGPGPHPAQVRSTPSTPSRGFLGLGFKEEEEVPPVPVGVLPHPQAQATQPQPQPQPPPQSPTAPAPSTLALSPDVLGGLGLGLGLPAFDSDCANIKVTTLTPTGVDVNAALMVISEADSEPWTRPRLHPRP